MVCTNSFQSTLNIIVEENKAYRARISALEVCTQHTAKISLDLFLHVMSIHLFSAFQKQVATASTDLKLFKSKISELEQLRAANKKK